MSILGVLLFAVAWLGLDYVLSVQSGWRALAAQFPASSRPAGPRVRWQVVRFGPTPEAGVTNMIPSPTGLCIYAGLLVSKLPASDLDPLAADCCGSGSAGALVEA